MVLVGAVVGGFSYTSHMLNRGGRLPESFESELKESIYYATEDPYEIYFKIPKLRKRLWICLKNTRRLNEIKAPTLILAGEFDIPDVHAHAGAINAGILSSKRYIIPNKIRNQESY